MKLAVVVALLLTGEPPVLLLDEPTRGLDYPAKAALTRLLRALAENGHTVVVATHDVEFAAATADEAAVMATGEVISHGPTPDILADSAVFAPQVAKILAPEKWLTVAQVAAALAAGARTPDAPEAGGDA
jgi:energy-coupling factor transport system ATP-binding protein